MDFILNQNYGGLGGMARIDVKNYAQQQAQGTFLFIFCIFCFVFYFFSFAFACVVLPKQNK